MINMNHNSDHSPPNRLSASHHHHHHHHHRSGHHHLQLPQDRQLQLDNSKLHDQTIVDISSPSRNGHSRSSPSTMPTNSILTTAAEAVGPLGSLGPDLRDTSDTPPITTNEEHAEALHPNHPNHPNNTYADAVMNGIHDPMNNLAVHSPASSSKRPQQLLPQIQEMQADPADPANPAAHDHHLEPNQQFPVHTTTTTLMPTINLGLGSATSQSGGEHTSEDAANSNSTHDNSGRTSRMSTSSEGYRADMSIDLNCVNRASTPNDGGAMSEEEFTIRDVVLREGGSVRERPASSSSEEGQHHPSHPSHPTHPPRRPEQLEQRPPPSPGQITQRTNGVPPPMLPRKIMPTIAPRGANTTTTVPSSAISTAVLTGREATAAHEREQSGLVSPPLVPPTNAAEEKKRATSFSKEFLRSPNHTLERLSYILGRGSLVMINFSQRNLGCRDAELIRSAILSNPQLSVLKLGYNNLGDIGANLIASAIQCGGHHGLKRNQSSEKKQEEEFALQNLQQKRPPRHRHHPSLSVLDLGFNNIGDEGCTSLAANAVSRNPALSTLYLSGNAVGEKGALALAEVVAGGCALTSLHLTANRIGPQGVKGLMRSIAEFDVTMQMAHQDRENRLALEEERRKRKELKRAKGRSGVNGSNDVDLESLGIDDDEEDENELPPDDLARLQGFKCMEELYLGGTNMESTGCLSVSNMLLTNLSLRTICLSDNGLNDQDLSLFSQSLSRNRELPLETLRLSFNKLTCVGVETLMNAIWGSKSLREIKLDNNQIRDRGAQLAAVVLTSVNLEVLDMGFNRLTIVGIKALMKSLAENRSLLTLTLSGNVLDTNASKAVSYALAYNKTIKKLYVDHCSLSYAAQRHIAAGIVSNSNLALRVMSGFPLGAISVTLGLPGAMETWSNEQVLKFIRVMWDRHRHEKEVAMMSSSKTDSTHSMSTVGGGGGASTHNSVNSAAKSASDKAESKTGPSDPATVVAAAKSAFEALGDAGGALLLTEEPQRSISDSSPMVSSDAVMLEKTPSGTIRVPSLDESDSEESYQNQKQQPSSNIPLEASSVHLSNGSLCTANGKDCPETPVDPAAKKRNMDWLRLHFRSLNEMIQLPYVHADLLQLYRYFYSPVDNNADGDEQGGSSVVLEGMPPPPRSVMGFNPGAMMPNHMMASPPAKLSGLQRKMSYRGLHDVMMGQTGGGNQTSPNFSMTENPSKRRPVCDPSMLPSTKRARNGKPRIDYFPRLKAKIEQNLSSSKQSKALVILRQLKFVETSMFHGGNPYCEQSSSASTNSNNEPIPTDAEVILIDML